MVATTINLTESQNSAATNLYNKITHIAVGDGVTTPAVSDTTLTNETYRDSLYSQSIASNVVNKDIRLDVTENNGNNINEIGSFTASSGGDMHTHDLTTSFAKTADKEAYYRLKTTYTAVNT